MTDTNGLDLLIRKVDRAHSIRKDEEEIVVSVLLNPDRKFWEWKEEEYYLVARRPGQHFAGSFEIRIDDFSHDIRLDLAVDYRVRMGDGKLEECARQIAEQLYDIGGPQTKLERLIQKWIEHYAERSGGRRQFILSYLTLESSLIESIHSWALDALSLDLHVKFRLRTDNPVTDSLEFSPFTVKVSFIDYDRAVDLKVDSIILDLADDPKERVLAFIRNGEQSNLLGAIKRRLIELVRGDYRLEEFRGNTVPARVKQGLKDGLRDITAHYGRTLRVLDLQCLTPVFDALTVFQSPDFDFPVMVPEYPREARVTATIQLELADLGKFAASGISKLSDWTEETLKSVIVPRLSRHTYLKLVTMWESEKLSIETELKKRASEVGYQYIYCNIATTLPFDRVRRPFDIEVSEELTTKNSESKVKIQVKAQVKITDMPVLAAKMPATEIDIDGKLQDAVRLVLRRVAKDHSPKAWHLNFDASKESMPLKDLLNQAIEKELKSEFGGTVLSIAITRLSDLVDALVKLREQTPDLTVYVTRSKFETKLAYRVVDVIEEHWNRFEATKPSIEDLNKKVTLHIEQMFADEDPATFRQKRNQDIVKTINGNKNEGGLPYMIQHQYGLEIYVDHWVREAIDIDSRQDEMSVIAEKAILDHEEELVRVGPEEKTKDIRVLRNRKDDVRKRIENLHPIDDKQEIESLMKILGEIDHAIAQMSSKALTKIMHGKFIDAEHQLASSLGQESLLLLNSSEGRKETSRDEEGGSQQSSSREDVP